MGIYCMIGELKSGLCNNLVGWDEEGRGRNVQEGGDIYIYTHLWLINVDVWQKPTQHCKAHIL